MRAIRFDGKHAVLVQDAPEPSLVPGEAIVRVLRAGVAECDVAAVRGRVPGAPAILGHEFVGVVERVEPLPGRDAPPIGQRVVAAIEVVCGKCDLCRRGLSVHCRDLAMIGVSKRDGCFAERVAVPIRSLAIVPAALPDDHAVLAVGAAAALHAAQIVRLEGRGFITVLGEGPAALLAAQAMAKLNATVRLVGSDATRLALAERWGVRHRHVDDVGRRQDQDVVVDCTGGASGLELALRLVRPRGTIILGATPAPVAWEPGGVDLSALARHEIELVGARSGRIGDGVSALAEGRFDVSGLITRRLRLSDGVAALRAAGDPGQVKVIIEM